MQHTTTKPATNHTGPGSLSALMEFDHPIQVHPDGTVSDAPSGVYAPSLLDGDLDSDKWEFASIGYTGQYGYNGPVMHNSEMLAGRLAEDILAEPGVYVAIVADYTDEDDPEGDLVTDGWAIVRLKD